MLLQSTSSRIAKPQTLATCALFPQLRFSNSKDSDFISSLNAFSDSSHPSSPPPFTRLGFRFIPKNCFLKNYLYSSAMEALSGSVFKSQSLIRTPSSQDLCPIRSKVYVRGGFCESNQFKRNCVVGLAREVSDDGDDKEKQNGFAFLSDKTLSVFQDNLVNDAESHSYIGESKSSVIEASFTAVPPSGGTRTGLFRTPISGGVQSATSAHGLPRPALAVRNLMEQARFAHLCTVMSRMNHRRDGYPFGSLVDFAPDPLGHPIFSFSSLAIHTRNLLADPRCTLVVQIPGWSGLSNARVTIFGDVFPLPEDQQEWAHKQYISKHRQGPSQQWGNFYYFRMENIRDIYFIGGFGTVAWIDIKEYESVMPDKIAVDGGEQNLKELNATFSKPLKQLLSTETEIDDAAIISIDSKGIDIRVREGAQFSIQRLSFEDRHGVETLEQAKDALRKLISKDQRSS